MRPSTLAISIAAALSLSASAALAQEAGFGGEPSASKNQVPGPSVQNPSDPAAGNPGSRAQIPTAPQKKENLYRDVMPPAGNTGPAITTKPQTSNPAQ